MFRCKRAAHCANAKTPANTIVGTHWTIPHPWFCCHMSQAIETVNARSPANIPAPKR